MKKSLFSVVSTNPANLLGYGTWAAFGAGKALVGLDSGDADFDVAEETGGSKTHTLTEAEMPAHTHTVGLYQAATASVYRVLTVDTNAAPVTTQATGSAGSGTAHSIVQPYIVVYMFKRTA